MTRKTQYGLGVLCSILCGVVLGSFALAAEPEFLQHQAKSSWYPHSQGNSARVAHEQGKSFLKVKNPKFNDAEKKKKEAERKRREADEKKKRDAKKKAAAKGNFAGFDVKCIPDKKNVTHGTLMRVAVKATNPQVKVKGFILKPLKPGEGLASPQVKTMTFTYASEKDPRQAGSSVQRVTFSGVASMEGSSGSLKGKKAERAFDCGITVRHTVKKVTVAPPKKTTLPPPQRPNTATTTAYGTGSYTVTKGANGTLLALTLNLKTPITRIDFELPAKVTIDVNKFACDVAKGMTWWVTGKPVQAGEKTYVSITGNELAVGKTYQMSFLIPGTIPSTAFASYVSSVFWKGTTQLPSAVNLDRQNTPPPAPTPSSVKLPTGTFETKSVSGGTVITFLLNNPGTAIAGLEFPFGKYNLDKQDYTFNLNWQCGPVDSTRGRAAKCQGSDRWTTGAQQFGFFVTNTTIPDRLSLVFLDAQGAELKGANGAEVSFNQGISFIVQ